MKTIIENLDSGWITLNSVIKYRKVNDIVYFNGASFGTTTLVNEQYTTIGTLPTGYRPTYETTFYADLIGSNPGISCVVKTDGSIQIYSTKSNTNYWRCGGSYPVD